MVVDELKGQISFLIVEEPSLREIFDKAIVYKEVGSSIAVVQPTGFFRARINTVGSKELFIGLDLSARVYFNGFSVFDAIASSV